MIYKDNVAGYDATGYPAGRSLRIGGYHQDELCLNCTKTIYYHSGWSCSSNGSRLFSKDNQHSQYLTKTMKDSLTPSINKATTIPAPPESSSINQNVDLSDWKSWAHKKDGDCPCGISRRVCDYHR